MNSTRPKDQSILRRHGAALVVHPTLQKATAQDLAGENIAVFVHGFTADSRYMVDLMCQFAGAGFACFAFEYPSDRGIDIAAKQLRDLLEGFDFDGQLSRRRLVLVGHSMGGLVCRAFVSMEGGEKFVKRVITLGSPHAGTLRDAGVLRLVLAWGESVSELHPKSFMPECTSGKQLMQLDAHLREETMLARLNSSVAPEGVFYDSISGSRSHIEFGRNPLRNVLANVYLSAKLSKPNDGLVEEASSNLASPQFSVCAPACTHHTKYTDYPDTNHSYLVNNHTVALIAVKRALDGV
jgi:pimeloyl-ACP methyl ester carboxylesterase